MVVPTWETIPTIVKDCQKIFLHPSYKLFSWKDIQYRGNHSDSNKKQVRPENVNKLAYLRENLGKVNIEKLVLEDEEEKEIERQYLAETEQECKNEKLQKLNWLLIDNDN